MADWEEGYIEAQAKQRTAYICRDMVQPLSVSLYDRIPALALVASRRAEVGQGIHCCVQAPTNFLPTDNKRVERHGYGKARRE